MRLLAAVAVLALSFGRDAVAQEETPAPAPTAVPEGTPAPAPPPVFQAQIRDSGNDLEVHGFVSPGFLVTTHRNNYLANTADRGSFEFAEVGINFTKPLTDRLRMGMQLFSRDLGSSGDYTEKVDWFYLDYRFRDWLGFRAGRVKLPFGLYNASSDIDQARVPVLLPQSVYPIANRDFLLAQTGGEVYGFLRLGAAGALDYRFYGGTIFLDTPDDQPGNPLQVRDLSVPYIAGGRVLWEPIEGLRAGGSVQVLRVDATFLVTQPPPGELVTTEIPALLWVASLEWLFRDWLLSAEYSRWHVEVRSSNDVLYPGTTTESERGYVMVSTRLTARVQPGLYYSLLQPDTRYHFDIPRDYQHDVAATVRVDINEHWLVKVEGHYMNGTAGLNPALNPEIPVADLADEWGVFLVKTTAFF